MYRKQAAREKGDERMKGVESRHLMVIYVCLAASCAVLGIGITSLVLLISQLMAIDILQNLWLLAIPPALTLLLNVLFIELYVKLRNK